MTPADRARLRGEASKAIDSYDASSENYAHWMKLVAAYEVIDLLDLADERDRLREAAVKAREALQHLRHCVSCGEGDWRDCYDGGRDALAAWQALEQVLGEKP